VIHGQYTWDRNAARVLELVGSLPRFPADPHIPGCCRPSVPVTLRRIAYVVNVFPKLSETFIAGNWPSWRRGVSSHLSLRPPSDTLCSRGGDQQRPACTDGYDRDEFRSLLDKFQPQLIHAHFATEPTAAARDMASELDLPFTFTAHGYDIYRQPPSDFSDRAAQAASVITVSRANAHHLVHALGVSPSQIQVIPCGVDLERFRPSRRRPGPPFVVCVARLVSVKNLGLLLEAFADLKARRWDSEASWWAMENRGPS
jgi:glycosyltransferase involved in cell wall biosynthesis